MSKKKKTIEVTNIRGKMATVKGQAGVKYSTSIAGK